MKNIITDLKCYINLIRLTKVNPYIAEKIACYQLEFAHYRIVSFYNFLPFVLQHPIRAFKSEIRGIKKKMSWITYLFSASTYFIVVFSILNIVGVAALTISAYAFSIPATLGIVDLNALADILAKTFYLDKIQTYMFTIESIKKYTYDTIDLTKPYEYISHTKSKVLSWLYFRLVPEDAIIGHQSIKPLTTLAKTVIEKENAVELSDNTYYYIAIGLFALTCTLLIGMFISKSNQKKTIKKTRSA